jgi:hypothetical protein
MEVLNEPKGKNTEPVNMNRIDNYFAIILGTLNIMLFNLNQDALSLLSACMSLIVLIVRNFRRVALVGYDFYLLASAKDRKEVKAIIQGWRNSLKRKKNEEEDDNQ